MPITYPITRESEIIISALNEAEIIAPTYIDIGAHHPTDGSTTAELYARGSTGINIEPNPKLISLFDRMRARDINLGVGIAATSGDLTYYEIADKPMLNTFSPVEASKAVARGHKIESSQRIQVMTLGEVVTRFCYGIFPSLLSVDAEGLDMEIMASLAELDTGPAVICVESLSYTHKPNEGIRNEPLIKMILDQGYRIYDSTHLNTILVDQTR